ncbi:cellulose synthase subunit BcsC-related outer membrane protein [Acidithiobacillus sp. IBUN Pt1247-S3]|uniref:cellulose synthase subunit BcsC-related outer membrane protein n=1 Tax=Acidithiobacillus sp. IBUN Pt1247-S3 TaxID=3166642 RepID=UPI0034E436BF
MDSNDQSRFYVGLVTGRLLGLVLLLFIWIASRPVFAAVVNHHESSNLVEQISGEKGSSSPELDAAVKNIWEKINQKNIALATAEIQSTEAKYHGWHPNAEMDFVLSELKVWQEIKHGSIEHATQELRRFTSRYAKGPEALQEQKDQISMQSVLMDRRLWWDLQQRATASEMRTKIKNAESEIPGYHPSPALLRVVETDQAADSVPDLAKKNDWNAVIALAQRYPLVFSSAKYPENALLLAHAQALSGNPLQASRYYYSQIQTSKNLARTQLLLNDASEVLPEFAVNSLYKTAKEKYPDATTQLERWHLNYLLGIAARWHAQGQNMRAWLLLMPQIAEIERAKRPSDARLIAAIQGALKHSASALQWWFLAARWSGKEEDWQTAGTLAMADGATVQAGEAMAHLPPESTPARTLYGWYFQQRAVNAFQHKDYEQTLYYLRELRSKQPLSAGMQSISAWSLIHLHEYSHASEMFHSLYRAEPNSDNAAGVALADYNTKSLASAYLLAQQVPGALSTYLPMPAMAANLDNINKITWRMNAKGQVILPAKRASFLLLGAGWMQRGGRGAGSSRLQEIAPGVLAQWGLNWHYSAFAQLHGSWLNSNVDSVQSTTPFGAAQSLGFVPSGSLSNWRAPSILLGIDDLLPEYQWRVGFGWTSPSSIGGGSPQAVLQYQHNIGSKGSYLAVDALRDALRQSWISYNGTRGFLTLNEPGKSAQSIPYEWGAAMRNQVGINGYYAGQKTMSWNYLATVHFNAITGHNIRSNYGWTSYLSAMKPVVVNESWWSAVGPALYSEGYARNENFTTPGYGNYYSPKWLLQPQLAVAVSHWWDGGSLSLAAGIGYQWARTAAAPLIGASALQGFSLAAGGGAIGEFAAADNSNISGSIDLRVTQKIGQNWYLDSSASYQANPAFSQTNVGVGIRYVFSGLMPRTLSLAALLGNMWRLNP